MDYFARDARRALGEAGNVTDLIDYGFVAWGECALTGCKCQHRIGKDEMVTHVRFQALSCHERGVFLKTGLRQSLAIAVVNLALVLRWDRRGCIAKARIALCCVAPTVTCTPEVEMVLLGRNLDDQAIDEACELLSTTILPIDDIRGSARLRRRLAAREKTARDGVTISQDLFDNLEARAAG